MDAHLYMWVIVLGCACISLVWGDDPVGKCHTCRQIATKFDEGLKKTAKSNFGGGNTKWEEKQLGKYAFSETRLLEIIEELCDDSEKKCHSMLEEWEETIENWWLKKYAKGKDTNLEFWLCINKMEVCCPNGTHGADCKECHGGKERPCKDNGECLGQGTRTGNGACKCKDGYKGTLCDECATLYYEVDKNETHTKCAACDRSCDNSCWGNGPEGCDNCKDGWDYEDGTGCTDIDECEQDPATCEEEEYCYNMQGTHKCVACDKACEGCTGPNNKDCKECADRHFYDELDLTCKACNIACDGACSDGTPKTCDECKPGYEFSEEHGCFDVNECETGAAKCEADSHCINSEGSFRCSTCHHSCSGCHSPGANGCKTCRRGYEEDEDAFCKDIDECEIGGVCVDKNEKCLNTPGSFVCNCQDGFVRTDGDCIAKPEEKTKQQKPKRKRKPVETDTVAKCRACNAMMVNFYEGMQQTDKRNFGGGNTKWEEKQLGKYSVSETRLIEITERLCGVNSECNSLLEQAEDIIEEWWLGDFTRGTGENLYIHLCVEKLQVCCQNGTYGPTCTDCMGGYERPCNRMGECDGDGTRVGNGSCNCTTGYTGDTCRECKDTHFEVFENETHTYCQECDAACRTGCDKVGPEGCDDCKPGWHYFQNDGCLDVNECYTPDTVCSPDQYCTNKPGSFDCKECDYSCDGCTASTNKDCKECRERYYLHPRDKICKVCHPACVHSCSDGTARTCDSCKLGYTFTKQFGCMACHSSCEGCSGSKAEQCLECKPGFARNDAKLCIACHTSCVTCSGPGPHKCIDCKNGFTMNDKHICTDEDECAAGLCDGDHRTCDNLFGSYECDCEEGYVPEGDTCVTNDDLLKSKIDTQTEEQRQKDDAKIKREIDNMTPEESETWVDKKASKSSKKRDEL